MYRSKRLTKKELKGAVIGGEQIRVILFSPDRMHDFDLIRLKLTTVEGETRQVDMTPDEALEIASCLTTAAMFWLMGDNKDYKKYRDEMDKAVEERLAKAK